MSEALPSAQSPRPRLLFSVNAMEDAVPFRLLHLPAELRVRIYEQALVAPDNVIRIYYSFQKNRIASGLALALLRSCRQVHREARDILYQENTVFVHADCHLKVAPVIGSSQLPPPALASLRNVFVVLDASDAVPYDYDEVDFRPFQAMTQLQRLRIAVVTQPDWMHATESWTHLLSYVIQRVPGSCRLRFGAETGAERDFTRRFCHSYRETTSIVEVPRDVLMRAAGYCQAEPGCKSGSHVDWRQSGGGDRERLEEVRTW